MADEPTTAEPTPAQAATAARTRDENGRFEPVAPAPEQGGHKGGPDGEITPTQSRADLRRAAFDEAADAGMRTMVPDYDETTEGEPQDAAAPTEGAAGPEQGAPAVVESGTGLSEDQQKARVSLLRSGFKRAEIDAMSAEDVLARGLERADVISSNADLVRRMHELEGKVTGTSTETPEPVAETAPALLDQLKPFIEAIEDEDAVKPLVDVITGLDSRLSVYEKRAAEAVQHSEEQLFLATRDRLVEQFHELSDDSRLPAVRARMELLAQDEAWLTDTRSTQDKFDDAMSSALRSLNYAETRNGAEPRASVDHLKVSGTATSPTTSEDTPQPATKTDRMRQAFDMLADGKAAEEIAVALRRA